MPPGPPMMRWAKIPRSWVDSENRTITLEQVERFLVMKMGRWGSEGRALRGRLRVVRLRVSRRVLTMLRMTSERELLLWFDSGGSEKVWNLTIHGLSLDDVVAFVPGEEELEVGLGVLDGPNFIFLFVDVVAA